MKRFCFLSRALTLPGLLVSIILITCSFSLSAQNARTIKGKVFDTEGTTLPGVSIRVEGTNTGTITNVEGDYSITVQPSQKVLVFTFVGMKEVKVTIGSSNTLNVTLEPDLVSLSEVISVGYSTKSRTEISGSVATISNDKLISTTSQDVESMLAGKIAGVMTMDDGQFAEGNASIRIRGTGSLSTNSEPLWVVDGVIGGSFDPNDVEMITVLKDAGATGLYGSRAANGVIVVTTKSGKKGKGVVSADVKVGYAYANLGGVDYMDSYEMYPLIKEGYLNAGRTLADFEASYSKPGNADFINFDWTDWYYDPSLVQSYNVSYSGGDDKNTIYISLNYFNEDGILRNNAFERGSSSIRATSKVSNKVSFNYGMFTSYSKADGNQMHTDPVTPFDKPYLDDGTVADELYVKTYWKQQEKRNNALVEETGSYLDRYQLKVNPNLSLNWDITNWMKFATTHRVNYTSNWIAEYQGKGSQLTFSGEGGVGRTFNQWFDYLGNYLLTFNRTFGDQSLNLLVGAEFNEVSFENIIGVKSGLLQGSEMLSTTSGFRTLEGTKLKTTYNSYFSQLNWNYLQKYFLTASLRRDGSSRFGSENIYGNFWSVAGSWLLNKEGFMSNFSFIDESRIRASYGLTGNANLDDYAHLATYSLATMYNGLPVANPLSSGNPSLTWEIARTTNIGFTLGLYKRVEVTLDYYNIKNDDLLYRVPLAGHTGYDEQWQNIGRLDNNGWDLGINADVIQVGKFNWNLDLQIGYNKDEIISIPDRLITNDFILEEGSPHYQWYLREWAGVDATTGAPKWYMHDADGNRTFDEGGNPITTSTYNTATRIKAGKATPDFMGGFTSNLQYGPLTFAAEFSFAFGNYYIMEPFEYDHDGTNNLRVLLKEPEGSKRWMQPGDENCDYPIYKIGNTNNSNRSSSRYLSKGDYFKVNALALSYDMPKSIVSKANMSAVKVYVRGENLKIFHNARVVSPEYFGFDGGGGTGGGERYDKAFPSKIMVGLSVNF
jgi:TonB-linked SusC/RagA family outer membrane protein